MIWNGAGWGLLLLAPVAMGAQEPAWQEITNAGVVRASASVDSVFIDHSAAALTVGGGDWAAYLMARLGVQPIPEPIGFQAAVDSEKIRLAGRLRDLPPQAQAALGPLNAMLDPDTRVMAEVSLFAAGPRAVQFHLSAVVVNGVPLPDALIAGVMRDVGRQYPALTSSGRDLFVEIPRGARVTLMPGGVRLTAPAAASDSARARLDPAPVRGQL